jgi:hypothetical protein
MQLKAYFLHLLFCYIQTYVYIHVHVIFKCPSVPPNTNRRMKSRGKNFLLGEAIPQKLSTYFWLECPKFYTTVAFSQTANWGKKVNAKKILQRDKLRKIMGISCPEIRYVRNLATCREMLNIFLQSSEDFLRIHQRETHTWRAQKNLRFQNDTENKWSILRTSHLHRPIEKFSKFCFKWSWRLSLLRVSARCH